MPIDLDHIIDHIIDHTAFDIYTLMLTTLTIIHVCTKFSLL